MNNDYERGFADGHACCWVQIAKARAVINDIQAMTVLWPKEVEAMNTKLKVIGTLVRKYVYGEQDVEE